MTDEEMREAVKELARAHEEATFLHVKNLLEAWQKYRKENPRPKRNKECEETERSE